MKFSILTIFPEMFPGPLGQSLAGKALEAGIWHLDVQDIRKFALDKHQTVDDKPFGGGNGMVMKPDVLGLALDGIIKAHPDTKIIYPSPRGKSFIQSKAVELSGKNHVTILCGRYEGIDQRVIDQYNIEEISMGDFILSGGEIAAYTVIDACLRLVPGVIVKTKALEQESFGGDAVYSSLLEYPHYTRPAEWRGIGVPEVLLSGNHAEIEKWRLAQAENITRERRKDLWEKYSPKKK